MKLNIEKNDLLQWIRYTAGLAICGFVIYCLTKTELGLAPWEILSKGISMHCPLSFGQVIIAVSVVVFIIDLLMKEVSAEVGYADQNYFSRIFKREFGLSPTEYRDSCSE